MHIAFNGWFWNRPDTGSGQYLHSLIKYLPVVDPEVKITLVVPTGYDVEPQPAVTVQHVALKSAGHRAKVNFEQKLFPAAAAEISADLVHVPYWAAPLNCKVPIVVTIHDLIPLLLPEYRGGLLARGYTSLVAASARGAAAVIADSTATRQDILQHLQLPAEHVHTIYLAAGDQYQTSSSGLVEKAIKQKYDLPPDYVLYLGGYDVRKNIATLLKAFTYVKDGAGDMHQLVLAGKLPERITPRFSDVHRLIDLMELHDVVKPIGWVDEADKPVLYRMAKVFVFPSRYEGFGLPVLEAMASGTPVITSTVSSLPEVVGDAGFLVDPDDARRLGGSILAHLVQDNLRAEMSQKAQQRAAEFSHERTAAQTLDVYRSVLAAV